MKTWVEFGVSAEIVIVLAWVTLEARLHNGYQVAEVGELFSASLKTTTTTTTGVSTSYRLDFYSYF